jgi:hypothetical protein
MPPNQQLMERPECVRARQQSAQGTPCLASKLGTEALQLSGESRRGSEQRPAGEVGGT